ncbi:MAG TPA: MarR family transcriptional regulator [Candidatus Limnocylindria bacterium]|nr:MarR family transcriptional regulator [Candidatus Limnocylindria bacterium]
MSDAASPDVRQLAQSLRVLIRRLRQRILSETGNEGITPSQRSLLALLYDDGPHTQADLAAKEHVRPQSLALVLAGLESLRYVTRRPHETDGRRILIVITAAGRRLLEDERARRTSWLVDALARELSAQELRELARAVPILEKLADAPDLP